ncbi:MAG: hypothetical protein KF876_15795 [Nitrospira sp.]|nr:hypothetical protein [Nitrospira sp.]
MRTHLVTTSLITAIVIGIVLIAFVLLPAIPLSSSAEQVGLLGSIRMDILFLTIFLTMIGAAFVLGLLFDSKIKAYLRSHLNQQGCLTETSGIKWAERIVTYLFLLAFGAQWLIQNICGAIHGTNQPASPQEVRDCYMLSNSSLSVLIGCGIGLFGAMYWAVRTVEREGSYRIYLEKPVPSTETRWTFEEIAIAMGIGGFLLYVFYRVFTLGR